MKNERLLKKLSAERHLIRSKLRQILSREDINCDGFINRKKSSKHNSEIEVLLEHVSLLVIDSQFEAQATRNELHDVRSLLEE